jgi:protocatechuate 3,4-dioxygenase beta subunit
MSKHENKEITTPATPDIHRRKFVQVFGSAVAAFPAVGLLGCTGGTEGSSSSAMSSSSLAASSSSSEASSSAPASSSAAASSSSEAPAVEGWARGGTASLTAPFPPSSPFGNSMPTTCSRATGRQILGPCFFRTSDYIREDISDGEVGLPTVFGFQVMDAGCNPMDGVTVEMWHTNCEGLYSDDRSTATEIGPGYWDGGPPFYLSCADNNARAMTKYWHRGGQVTNADGIVYFKSCFPYWYAGRTTHIHLRFMRNGMELLTTQFGFADSLCNDIHLNHPEYSHVNENGGKMQDKTMQSDPEFGGSSAAQWLMESTRQRDGSLLTYKSIIIA